MTHFDYEGRLRPTKLPEKERLRWLGVTGQVSKFVSKVSKRSDMVANVGPGCGHGASACFIPNWAQVEVDTNKCFGNGDPDEVDLESESFRMRKAAFVGAIVHESAHAAFTPWVPATLHEYFPDMTQRLLDVFMTLEEPRIEHQLLTHYDSTLRPYLKACVAEIVAHDFKIGNNTYSAAASAALLLARVTGGTLEESEAEHFRTEILTKLDEDTLSKLEVLWTEFLSLSFNRSPGDAATIRGIEICREWLEVLQIDENDPMEQYVIVFIMPGEESEEGEGEEDEGEEGGFGEAIRALVGEFSSGVERQMVSDGRRMEQQERRKSEQAEKRRQRDAAKHAKRLFHGEPEKKRVKDDSRSGGGGHGYSPATAAKLLESRPPTSEERIAANKLSRELSRAQYRDFTVSKKASAVAPGRLRGRAAVQQSAQRSMGIPITAQPWRTKKRRWTEDPELTCGIITDISGSMGEAQEISAILSWAMSEAVRKIDGTVATVLMGTEVHGVVRSGAKQPYLNIFRANDGHENFTEAFQAVDGELNLLHASGARVLVIFTDAWYSVSRYADFAAKAMSWCSNEGVAVLWVQTTQNFVTNYGWGETVNVKGMKPVDAAVTIGQHIVKALEAAQVNV